MKEINYVDFGLLVDLIDENVEDAKEICNVEKRRKCDSLYISLNKRLKKRMNKARQIIKEDTNDSCKDLKNTLYELLNTNFEDNEL